jgi:hypothetical protein
MTYVKGICHFCDGDIMNDSDDYIYFPALKIYFCSETCYNAQIEYDEIDSYLRDEKTGGENDDTNANN